MAENSKLTSGFIFSRLALLVAVNILLFTGCLMVGSVETDFGDLLKIFDGSIDPQLYRIIIDIRMPRLLLAVAVGGGLSVAGGVLQAVLMNPLAEPYILGISSGGTFGAILSIMLGFSFLGTQLFAFAGALGVILLVFLLGRRFGEIEPNVLLLSGVMVGAFFSAAILLLITLDSDSFRTALFWLIGNLSIANRESIYSVLPLSILFSLILIINAHKYNVLALGVENARHLGINTKRLNNITYIISSLLIGSIVSVSGIIGFVGLLIPHVCRMLFGYDNKIVLPASYLLGASYLMSADTLARSVISPSELPVGAITAIIGAPIFVYLLRRRFKDQS